MTRRGRRRSRKPRAATQPKSRELDALLAKPLLSLPDFDLGGEWQCRTIKAGGLSPLVVYGWFKCTRQRRRLGLEARKDQRLATNHRPLLRRRREAADLSRLFLRRRRYAETLWQRAGIRPGRLCLPHRPGRMAHRISGAAIRVEARHSRIQALKPVEFRRRSLHICEARSCHDGLTLRRQNGEDAGRQRGLGVLRKGMRAETTGVSRTGRSTVRQGAADRAVCRNFSRSLLATRTARSRSAISATRSATAASRRCWCCSPPSTCCPCRRGIRDTRPAADHRFGADGLRHQAGLAALGYLVQPLAERRHLPLMMDWIIPRLIRLERVIRPRYWPFWRRQGDRIIGCLALRAGDRRDAADTARQLVAGLRHRAARPGFVGA